MDVFSVAILLAALAWFTWRVSIAVILALLDILISVLRYVYLVCDVPWPDVSGRNSANRAH